MASLRLTDETLRTANQVLQAKLKEHKPGDIYKQLHTVFLSENESDGPDGGFKDIRSFTIQRDRIADVVKKPHGLKPTDLQLRLTKSGILNHNIFEILGLTTADFLGEVSKYGAKTSTELSDIPQGALSNETDEEENANENQKDSLVEEIQKLIEEVHDMKELLYTENNKERMSYLKLWRLLLNLITTLQLLLQFFDSPEYNGFDKIKPLNDHISQNNPLLAFMQNNLWYWLSIIQKSKSNKKEYDSLILCIEWNIINKYSIGIKRNKILNIYNGSIFKEKNDIEYYRFISPLMIIYLSAYRLAQFIRQANRRKESKAIRRAYFELFNISTDSLLRHFSNIEKTTKKAIPVFNEYPTGGFAGKYVETEKILCQFINIIGILFSKPEPNLKFEVVKNIFSDIQSFVKKSSIIIPGKNMRFSISEETMKDLEDFEKLCINNCETLLKDIEISIDTSKRNREELRPVQIEAIQHIHNTWAAERLENGQRKTPICSLDMGDGKTKVACEIIKEFRKKEDIESYILIIAPAGTLKETWKTHLKDYFDIYSSVMGDERKKYFNDDGTEVLFRPKEIVITSYQTAVNDCALYMRTPPALIVYDEIQYLNNSKKQLTACQILAKLNVKVDYKLGLSGTPAQNSVDEFIITYCFFNDSDSLHKYFEVYRKNQQEKRKLIAVRLLHKITTTHYFGIML